MIRLNDNLWFEWLDYMPYFFYYPHKADDLKFRKLVVSFCRGEQSWKKKYWLNSSRGEPTSFQDDFAGDSVEDNGSKAKFLEASKSI